MPSCWPDMTFINAVCAHPSKMDASASRRPATEISQCCGAGGPCPPHLNRDHGVPVQPVQNQRGPTCSDKKPLRNLRIITALSSLMAPTISKAPIAPSGTSSRWESDSPVHRNGRPRPDLTFVVISCPTVMTPPTDSPAK